MIVVGSYAASVRGVPLQDTPADVDMVATPEEMDRFRDENRAFIESESRPYGNRTHFQLKPGQPWRKVEFSHGPARSNILLARICTTDTVPVLASQAFLPSVNVLYLTKRAHAHIPVFFLKALVQLHRLQAMTTPFSGAELEYFQAWKQECNERLEKHRQQFRFDLPLDAGYAVPDQLACYARPALHRALALYPGNRQRQSCREALDLGMLEREQFMSLAPRLRLRLLQEEFTYAGVERFHLQDRALDAALVYRNGMVQTMLELPDEWLRDYALDHARELARMPAAPFLERLSEAERRGELLPVSSRDNGDGLAAARRLFLANRLHEALPALEAAHEAGAAEGNDVAAYYVGRTLRRMGDAAGAARWFHTAIGINGNRFQTWHELGDVLLAGGRPGEAVSACQRALELESRFTPARINLGLALRALDRVDEARTVFARALARQRDDQVHGRLLRQLLAATRRRVQED